MYNGRLGGVLQHNIYERAKISYETNIALMTEPLKHWQGMVKRILAEITRNMADQLGEERWTC